MGHVPDRHHRRTSYVRRPATVSAAAPAIRAPAARHSRERAPVPREVSACSRVPGKGWTAAVTPIGKLVSVCGAVATRKPSRPGIAPAANVAAGLRRGMAPMADRREKVGRLAAGGRLDRGSTAGAGWARTEGPGSVCAGWADLVRRPGPD